MKRKLLILSLLAIGVASLTAGTLAYFNAEDTAHNVITSGGVNIQIVEKTKDEGGALVEFPAGGLTGIMPGTAASKIVSVTNTGASEAWIRVKLDLSIRSAGGDKLPAELTVGQETIPVVDPEVKEGWLAGTGGYYYYTKPVASQDSTTNFMETVRFAPQMGNEYQGCTVTLVVSAQAVQTAHNPIPQGGDVTGVTGWPTEAKDQEVSQ